MFFCGFPMPEPSGTLGNIVQNSILVNTGHAPIEIPATSQLQTVSKHKQGNSKEKENILLCSRSMCSARDREHRRGPWESERGTQEPAAGAGCPGTLMLRTLRLRAAGDIPCNSSGGGKQRFGEARGSVHSSCPASRPGCAQTDSQAPAAVRRSGGSSSARAQLNVLLLSCPRTGLLQGRMSLLTPASSARRCVVQAPQQQQHAFEGEYRVNVI